MLSPKDIPNGSISGDKIAGGTIQQFSSQGIRDEATSLVLVVRNGYIKVDKIETSELSGNILVSGNIKVTGVLDVGTLKADKFVTNQKFDQQFFEFTPPKDAVATGSGFIWRDGGSSKLFLLKGNPSKFFLSEGIDIGHGKDFSINGVTVINESELGASITQSSLKKVGRLHSLEVTGDVNLGDVLKLNTETLRIGINTDQPVGIMTLTDYERDVFINIEVDAGRGKIGTFNNRPFDITAGDQALISLDPKGIVTLGHEYKSDTVHRLYGKVGVNVKNPENEFEVRGAFKFHDRIFLADNKPPEKGNYKRGDIVWNDNPYPGEYVGWVCVSPGNPGSWNPFGRIET